MSDDAPPWTIPLAVLIAADPARAYRVTVTPMHEAREMLTYQVLVHGRSVPSHELFSGHRCRGQAHLYKLSEAREIAIEHPIHEEGTAGGHGARTGSVVEKSWE